MWKNSSIKKSSIGLIGLLIILVIIAWLWRQNSVSVVTPIHNAQIPQPTVSENLLSPAPAASASASARILTLRLFFVALNDNGAHGEKIGCGDTIAPVNIQMPETQTPIQAVMEQLLTLKQKTVGPSSLYNSLSQSNLQFKDAAIRDGVATIHLTGQVNLTGECDHPRFQAQLEKTAGQFSNVNSVNIYINNKPLSEAVSLK